jgi:hypothetical protein
MSLKPSPLKSWVSASLLAAGTATAESHGLILVSVVLSVKTIAGCVLDRGVPEEAWK